MKDKRLIVAAVTAIVAVLAVILAYAAYNNYEVVAKGQLLPYTNGFIHEILLFDNYLFYVEMEIRFTGDVLNSVILLGIAFISMTFASILYSRKNAGLPPQFSFFTILSCGMFYLAADELLGIHETIGHNLQFLTEIPFIKHPDDLIIASYGVLVLIFLFVFRSVVFGSRRPLIYFGTASLLFVVAAIADVIAIGETIGIKIEDHAEIASAILILTGTLSIGLAAITSTNPENGESIEC